MEQVSGDKDFIIDAPLHDKGNEMLQLLSKVLKEYSSPEQFEKDWDCRLLRVMGGGISGVVFNNDSAISAFYLKYNK